MTNSKLSVKAKNLVTAQRYGILSTLSVSQHGYPFGSLVPYDITEHSSVIIYISLIAEHYKNLKLDCRASLCVTDALSFEDPQSHARATILLDFKEIPESERKTVQQRYEQRFPGSINHEIAHNFLFMIGTPTRVRWIGGFGEIAWISPETFNQCAPDPLAYESAEILEHMNNEHPEALRDFAKAFGQTEAKRCHMIAITQNEFQLAAYAKTGQKVITVPFTNPVTTSTGVHHTLVAMLKTIRSA